MSNLQLWDQLAQTDPQYTSKFKRPGGFQGTAISPMWAARKATEAFGPIGIGWWYEEVERETVPVGDGQVMIFIKVIVWYVYNRERGCAGPQWGGDFVIKQQKNGLNPDDEAYKKALTDAVTKCLTYIGIGADVHMGQFDDSKYVEQMNAQYGNGGKSNAGNGKGGNGKGGNGKGGETTQTNADADAVAAQLHSEIARTEDKETLRQLYADAQKRLSPRQHPQKWQEVKDAFAERGEQLEESHATHE